MTKGLLFKVFNSILNPDRLYCAMHTQSKEQSDSYS